MEKNLALVIHHSFELEQMQVESEMESEIKGSLKEEFQTCILRGREALQLYVSNCDHDYN